MNTFISTLHCDVSPFNPLLLGAPPFLKQRQPRPRHLHYSQYFIVCLREFLLLRSSFISPPSLSLSAPKLNFSEKGNEKDPQWIFRCFV